MEEEKRPSCFNAIYGSSKKTARNKRKFNFFERGERLLFYSTTNTHTHTHAEITKLKKGLREGKSIVIALISSWKRMRGGYVSSGKET